MQNLSRLAVFTNVAQHGSFSGAANALNISKSSVSKQVTALEEHLGIRLFLRGPRHVQLTDEGRALLQHGETITAEYAQVLDLAASLKGTPSGTVSVSMPRVFGFSVVKKYLGDFLAQYPQLKLRHGISQNNSQQLSRGDDTDITIVVGEQPDSSLICRRIASLHTSLYASREYLQQHQAPRRPSDLQQHNCLPVDYPNIDNFRLWRLIEQQQAVEVEVDGNLIMTDVTQVIELVQEGYGISMLPDYAVREAVAAGELVQLLPQYHGPNIPAYLIYSERRHLSPKLRVTIDFLTDCFRTEGLLED
ncbi:DNA-binding transcriptional LysR family regulator [Sinobacterium caligoides]|uniref:DNA-binding transcriptional LysR family regulator n=1 Tax=Sinobacterium caligoides TaxID=933926 RepID=A0A3N2DQR3_9GAMM|nr:LysR family transcriptional regulator [Sinobacterium caligoides]ROS02012.1 DNA-binding transcriptional LysR family regulator [Sinobacterium caligoides]